MMSNQTEFFIITTYKGVKHTVSFYAIQIELAMRINFHEKIARVNTVEDTKDSNSQSLATKAKKGKQLVPMMPALKKTFDLNGDEIVELNTENQFWKNIGTYNQKWLESKMAGRINNKSFETA